MDMYDYLSIIESFVNFLCVVSCDYDLAYRFFYFLSSEDILTYENCLRLYSYIWDLQHSSGEEETAYFVERGPWV